MRPIDADAFKKYLKEKFKEVKDQFQTEKMRSFAQKITNDFCRDIDEQPPIDVAPVVHAANITDENPVDQFVCSDCGIILEGYVRKTIDEDDGAEIYHEYEPRFCPDCGAKLDKNADAVCVGNLGPYPRQTGAVQGVRL